jgi:hypothetical protein
MPLGIHRSSSGIVASARAPIAISSPFAIAMTCTVPMWFCTPHHLRIRTAAWFGRTSTTLGAMVRKYGALSPKASENAPRPSTGTLVARS